MARPIVPPIAARWSTRWPRPIGVVDDEDCPQDEVQIVDGELIKTLVEQDPHDSRVSRHGGQIDREIGDMVVTPGAASWTGPKQFAYVRYDPDVSRQGLDKLGLGDVDADSVQVMDSVKHIPAIQRVGAAYAQTHVLTAEHLRGFV